MDTAGKALLRLLAEQVRQRQQEAPLGAYQDLLHIAERNDLELANRMRALLHAQQELDDYVLSLAK